MAVVLADHLGLDLDGRDEDADHPEADHPEADARERESQYFQLDHPGEYEFQTESNAAALVRPDGASPLSAACSAHCRRTDQL